MHACAPHILLYYICFTYASYNTISLVEHYYLDPPRAMLLGVHA